MGRFAVSLAACALALGACTPLDDPHDLFKARHTSSVAGGATGSGGAATGGELVASDTGGAGGLTSTGDGGQDMGGSGGGVSAAGGDTSTGGAGGGGTDAGCFDSHGFDGNGCYVCPATDLVGLENACSAATCTRFDDDARLSKLTKKGDLPPLPAPGAAGAAGSGGAGGAAGAGGAGGKGGTGGAAAGGAGGGGGSSGRVACDSLASKGKVVYVTGSTAVKPFLQQIAAQIASQNAFVVYTSTGSCVGVDAVFNGTHMTTGPSPAPAAFATYWDGPGSPGVECDLPAAGVVADLGVSDVFAQSCAGFELSSLDAARIRDAHGPIQTIDFVVPSNSRFSEISARAAYFVFGFGADGGVLDGPNGAPIWNDETALHRRSAASGTQTMVAAAIGVPPGAWKGTAHATSDEVTKAIRAAGQSKDTADKALGILAADYVDGQNLRPEVRVLAFQDTAQRCAVFADSTLTAHDKQNVRDGHYPIWSPLHLLYKVDEAGNPTNAASRQILLDIIGYLSGTKQLPNGVALIDVYAQTGLIPECAMHVTRTKDGGNIVPFTPDAPCSCLFDAKATGATSCKTCRVQGDCPRGQACSQGFCER